ncbi:MAG: hypothetical protein KAW12_21980 [Candidatus Aminicenantes bacterium]|nr:hypothetical protein [Candidatus Aminicenantes bacterium]
MEKTDFLTIFAGFENLPVVEQTLPAVIEETRQNDARLIVHDSSVKERDKKWEYLKELNKNKDFFLLLSDNLSMAHARNMCLHLGQELMAPEYICVMEDDHGFKPGLIQAAIKAMKTYYGKKAPNGLRYGLFSGCGKHHKAKRELLPDGNAYPASDNNPAQMGRANSCFRCAPTSHWNNVLKGYDTDEYLISTFQTNNLNLRNYFKGFTMMIIQNGDLMFDIEVGGRGVRSASDMKLWDEKYTASDSRSRYLGKDSV